MSSTGKLLALAGTVLCLTGCLHGSSASVQRHTLYLAPPEDYAAQAGTAPNVRVDLPRFVEDQYLLRRADDGTLRRVSGHVWAESPDQGFARLLREHLAARGGLEGDRLRIQFTRFEADRDAMFYALGEWQLRVEGRSCAQGHLGFQSPLADDEVTTLVDAMNA
ncbi:MAG: PqiC family protein, partial [Algiphilus sp.]